MKNLIKFTLLLLAFLLPATALAHDFEVDGIYYNINGTNATVTYKGTYSWNHKTYSGDVTIPSTVTYNGTTYFVTSIDYSAFSNCSGLMSITIPNTVSSIHGSSFSGCSGLTSITVASGNMTYDSRNNCNAIIETETNTLIAGCKNTVIPDFVTSIGNDAFSGCSGLTSVTIPNSVTSIGYSAFEGCSGLNSITIPNSITFIGSWAFMGCSNLKDLNFNAESCADFCFSETDELHRPPFYGLDITTISIGNNVKRIPSLFALGLTTLTSVTIPNSVTSIGSEAFSDCPSLTSVTIGNSVTSIGGSAFSFCTSLTSVTIGNSVTSIGGYAFYECSALSSLSIPNSVTSIGGSAFEGTAWYNNQSEGVIYAGLVAYKYKGTMPEGTSITLNEGTLGITDYAFSGCSGMTSISIPNTVTTIGYSAFSHCRGLTSITIPNAVTSISGSMFYGCTSMTSISIPNSVTSIGGSAFSNCTSLTSVTIPNSIKTIESSTFYNCSALKSITIPNTITSIGNDAFYGCSGITRELTIPESVTSIGYRAFQGCTGINTLNFNAVSCSDFSSTASYRPFYNLNFSTINIGDGVQRIPDYLAYGMSNLNSLTIPNSVTSIGNYAFYSCSGLAGTLVIPGSVKFIGKQAFNNVPGLEAVTCEAETPPTWNDLTVFTTNVYNHSPLYVPMGCARAYMSDQCWGQFASIISTGDMDGNGKISIADVTELIDRLISNESANNPATDVDGDGSFTVADATALIDILLSY